MPEEYEIQAVMVNADCDRATAIKALKWSRGSIGWAIKRVVQMRLYQDAYQEEE